MTEHKSLFLSGGNGVPASQSPPVATSPPAIKEESGGPSSTPMPSPSQEANEADKLQQIIHLESKLLNTTIQIYTGTEIRRPEDLPAGVFTRYDITCFDNLSDEEKKTLYQVYIKFPTKHIECYASLFIKACDAIGKEFRLYKVAGIDPEQLQSDMSLQRFVNKAESLQKRIELAWESKVAVTEFKKLVIDWMTAWSVLVRYYANMISEQKKEA
jgi:hypothetical protein